MLDLLLLRHAKSSWDPPGLDDRSRPLTGRGRRAAQAMGRAIAARQLVPDLVLCSPARRTRETWEIAAAELAPAPAFRLEEALYDFGGGSGLLQLLQGLDADVRRVLLVGHNPALENLALQLIGPGGGELAGRLRRKFPTAALAVIRYAVARWQDLTDGQGELAAFIRPRDIIPEAAGEE